MTVRSDEPTNSPTLAALTELVMRNANSPTSTQLSRGLNAVMSVLAVGRARQRALQRLSLAAVVAATCLAAILGVVSWSQGRRPESVTPALAFQMQGGTVIEGGYIRETGDSGITVSFSEGTKFTLARGTHGRLRSVDSAGARIAIDSGSASIHVAPRADAKWLVDVGPFLVTVKGTIFSVSWDVSSERFEIDLQQGRVTVSGPVSGGDLALRSGQRLVVNLPKSETVITEDKPDAASPDALQRNASRPACTITEDEPDVASPDADATLAAIPSVESPADRLPNGPSKPRLKDGVEAPLPLSVNKTNQPRWAEAVAAADWDRILRDTETAGVNATLEKASSEDLFALADAARYRRRMALAREALLTERRRFPSSARSLDAAYLLGRVEESSERGLAVALTWYDEYLARAPIGTYASEALGRKMILTNKLKGMAQARPLAEEYLQRFPNGTYAGSARALRRAP